MSLAEYTISNQSDHEIAKRLIYRILITQAIGRDNAVTGRSLADRVPVGYSTVRDLIPRIRRETGLPIGSSNQGYFVIVSEGEFRRQVERQRRQAEKSLSRAREITSAWYQSQGGSRES